jgi:diacylglycerol kinase family enzyme
VQAVLVVNPYASRVTEARLAAIERELTRVVELTIVRSEYHGHATELVTAACRDGCDVLIVFSGDGGFNEALNGLEGDVPIGFLPGGGTSVLPRALGLPAEPLAAAVRLAESIEQWRTRRISLGRVNGRRFAFNAGVGIDAEAVRRVDEKGRRADGKRPGDLAFIMAVVKSLASRGGHVEPVLEVKGLGRAASAFVANAAPYTYAKRLALPIAPEAAFELGLDVVAPIRVRRRSLVRTTWAVLLGHPRYANALYAHDVDRIEIICDHPMPLHADGEDLGDVEHAIFEAERSAVEVFV